MRVLDFANSRRAYLLNKAKPDDCEYKFFLSSGRKEYFEQSERDLSDLKWYAPETLCSMVTREELESCIDYDVAVTTSCSLYFKEYQKEAVDFLNRFKGKIVAVDYAWDVVRTNVKKKNKQLKKKFSQLAIAVEKAAQKVPVMPFSQPEIDMYRQAYRWAQQCSVLTKYHFWELGAPYVLVTSQYKYDLLDDCIDWLKSQPGLRVVWKLKEKQSEYKEKVEDALKRHGMTDRSLIVVSAPKSRRLVDGKSHTCFLSPVCEWSTAIDFHISLPPLCFSHAEMVRGGVPTYMFTKNGLKVPEQVHPLVRRLWGGDDVDDYLRGGMVERRSELKHGDLWFSDNFWKNIR